MGRSYQFGDCRVDPERRELWRGGKLVVLPPPVFDFLSYLIVHHERAVGRDELVAAVWGKTEISDTLLGQTVLRLRRELGDDAKAQHLLRTIPRFGYRWVAPVQIGEAPETVAPVEAIASSVSELATPAPPLPRSSRARWAIGVICLAVVLSAGAVLLYFRNPAQTPPANAGFASAVLPAEVEPSAEWAWMRLGVMDMIATGLRTGGVPSVPSDNVVAYLSSPAARGAGGLREVTAAHLVVTPRVHREAADWRIGLDADDGAGRHYAVEAQAGEIGAAARAATDKLLAALGVRAAGAHGEIAYADWLEQVDAAVLADDPASARHLIEQASAEQRQAPDVRLRLAKLDFRAGQFEQARTRLLALLDEAPANTAPVLRASIYNGLGAVAVRMDDAPAAEIYFNQAIALLLTRGDAKQLGEAYLGRAAAAADQHHYDAALAGYAEARIALREANDALALVRVAANEGFLDLEQDRPAPALTQLQAASESFRRWGALNEAILTSVGEIDAHLAMLDGAAALHSADAAAAIAQRIDNPGTLASLMLARAQALAASGRLREARAVLEDLRHTPASPLAAAAAGAVLAEFELEGGDAAKASDLAEQAIAALVAPSYTKLHARAGLTAVRAALRKGYAARALTAADELETWAQRNGEVRARLFARLARAEYTRKFGANWRMDFDAARELAEHGGVPFEVSTVARSYGAALLAEGDLPAASIEIGRVARWAEQDFDCAVLEARLFSALGRDAARQTATAAARTLAGERSIPVDALSTPLTVR
jgi:DNA-binding winged helix-turn-helix (wHTH) protein